jgi:hypothetical protein
VTTEMELLPGFKSVSVAATLATLVSVPLVTPGGRAVAVTVTTLVTVAMAPAFKAPRLTKTLAGVVNTLPCDVLAETTVTALSLFPYVPVPTFGLETIFQLPATVVVGPGVGVADGTPVGVGVLVGMSVRVGVGVFLKERLAGPGCTLAPATMPIKVPVRSRMPITMSNPFRYFQCAFIVFLSENLRIFRYDLKTKK